jgi:hypothetical protein
LGANEEGLGAMSYSFIIWLAISPEAEKPLSGGWEGSEA